MQDLWQLHHQTLLIISQKKFTKLNVKIVIVFLDIKGSVKDYLIKDKCLFFNKNYSKKIVEELKKRFKNTFKFSNNCSNKFILLLRKDVSLYQYMKQNFLKKEIFYSNLSLEDNTYPGYMHAKRVCKNLK